jgi:hypothetical protein
MKDEGRMMKAEVKAACLSFILHPSSFIFSSSGSGDCVVLSKSV